MAPECESPIRVVFGGMDLTGCSRRGTDQLLARASKLDQDSTHLPTQTILQEAIFFKKLCKWTDYTFCYFSALKTSLLHTDCMYILSSKFFSNFEIFHHSKIVL